MLSRRSFMRLSGICAAGAAMAPLRAFAASSPPAQKKNILFIAVDDMNDWIGPLSRHLPKARTPNLDRLASMGVTFSNAHCASPVCHPSRLSVMTGVHPARSGVTNNVFESRGEPTWRSNEVLKDVVTLSQHFRNHGYRAFGTGKIYHALQWWDGSECPAEDWDQYYPSADKPIPPWPRPALVPDAEAGLTPGRPLGAGQLFGANALDVPDEETSDYQVVEWASEKLGEAHDKPFFLACGIFRPHIPWEVPKAYFDLYPLEEIVLPPHRKDDLADAFSHGREGWHRWVMENDLWEKLVQGYLASLSYADAMLGKLLDAFEQSPHRDRTIVALWSDHGMHIGEKENWEKFTLWEESTRVPLMICLPGLTKAGSRAETAVSLIDLYPTLCGLAGLPVPAQCDGEDLTPILEDVSRQRSEPVVTSFTFLRRKPVPGHTVRDERWRYIRYANGFEELYDHAEDPHEYTNLAGDRRYEAMVKRLRRFLPKQALRTEETAD